MNKWKGGAFLKNTFKNADFDKAVNIIINAKTQRTGVCNAAESLVVHKDIAENILEDHLYINRYKACTIFI